MVSVLEVSASRRTPGACTGGCTQNCVALQSASGLKGHIISPSLALRTWLWTKATKALLSSCSSAARNSSSCFIAP